MISLHPGTSAEEVKENSGFEIIMHDKIETSHLSTDKDLRILRQEIDPAGIVIGT